MSLGYTSPRPSTPPFFSSSSNDSNDSNDSTDSNTCSTLTVHSLAAINCLDSLHNFYEHEQAWVYRTRAAMELALVQGPIEVNPTYSSMPSSSSSSSENPANNGFTAVKTEANEDDLGATGAATKRHHSTRWHRRKNGMGLRLEGLSPHNNLRRQKQSRGPEPGTQLLEQFGELVDARMESCRRITRLVRESSRAVPEDW